MALTDLQVKKLVPKDARYEVLDDKGLYIRVTPSGTKSWIFRYMFKDVARIMTFGKYPGISLAKAYEKHAVALQKIQSGIDPGAEAKEQKRKRKVAPTFKDLLDEFWEIELMASPSGSERKRLVEKDALPSWRKKKVSSITRRDAVLLVDKVRKRAPITANRLQGVLVRMFNFACERGILDFSPLAGMRRGRESSRSRVLADDEIKTLWKCLDPESEEINVFRVVKLALKAILLTGQRPGEVVQMTWEQVKDLWWTIPAEISKNRIENRVPILPMMADLLEQAKVYSGNTPYVFASARNDKKPVTVGALANSLRRSREKMKVVEAYTPHDLRRTVRTRLAEIGVSDVVAERVLGHKLQGVLGIYNRHSYDVEKRQALVLWEKRLSQILGDTSPSGNVIEFPGVSHG